MNLSRVPPCLLVCAALLLCVPPAAWSGAPALRVTLSPGLVVPPGAPLEVSVTGGPPRGRVDLDLLQDCDGDGRPDLPTGRGRACPPVGLDRLTSTESGEAHATVDLATFGFTRPQPLWLRARSRGGGAETVRFFGIGTKPCSLLDSLLALFGKDACVPDLAPALLPMRGGGSWLDARYEVRWKDTRAEADVGRAVPGSVGATGVHWTDDGGLLVAFSDSPRGTSTGAGLYRHSLEDAGWSPIWTAPRGRAVLAPLALPDGRMAFFLGRAAGPGKRGAGDLILLRGSKVDLRMPLEQRLDALLAAGGSTPSFLGLLLHQGDPALLQVDTAARTVTDLGFPYDLYFAVSRDRSRHVSAVCSLDRAGPDGWDVLLLDDRGRILRPLQSGPGNAVLPAWSPSGHRVAYLAEVEPEPGVP